MENNSQVGIVGVYAAVGGQEEQSDLFDIVEPAVGIHHEVLTEAEASVTSAASTESVEDDNVCSICFESYTTSGAHRMSCLKCGHLFGRRCIEKWFQQAMGGGANRSRGFCPTCKQKAKRTDIRDHYCRGVKIIDTSEKDEACKERDREREERKKLQIELASSRSEISILQEELRQLKQQVSTPRYVDTSGACSSGTSSSGTDRGHQPFTRAHPAIPGKSWALRMEPVQKIEICKSGEARVMDYMSDLAMLVASSKSSTHLFPGYGVLKVHTALLRSTKFVRIHSQAIRDVKFTPSRDALILTASLDKCLKVTSVHNDHLVHSWNVNWPLWSCCWKPGETHYVFAGTNNGKVRLYDSRMPLLSGSQGADDATLTSAPVETFDCGDKGVIGLQWVDLAYNVNARGLLVSMIDRLMFLEQITATEFRPHILVDKQRITSTSYHGPTQHFLASFGPSGRREKVEHVLHGLSYRNLSTDPTKIEPSYSCNPIQSFAGGVQQVHMCRNALFSHPYAESDSLIGLVYDELSDKLQLWDATSGQHLMDAPKTYGTMEKMLHLANYNFDGGHMAGALGTKSLYLYKMIPM